MTIQEEMTAKHGRVAAFLAEHKLDGVLLTRRANFSWFTCGAYNHVNTATETGSASLLVTADKVMTLSSNIEAARLKGEGLGDRDIEVISYPWHSDDRRLEAFRRAIAARNVAADFAIPGLPTAPLPVEFNALRVNLLDSEVARYREVAQDVAEAIESVAQEARKGNTEYELAGLMHAVLLQRDCLPWVTLVAGDERVSQYRHPLPTSKAIQKYAMLVTCAERDGLVVSCTRLYHFGRLPSELSKKAQACARIDATLIDATRPGATLGGVLANGIDAYKATGYPEEWQLHHQGGSAGYLTREVIATPGSTVPVLENQAFAWNPSITGTKSEDTTLCTADDPEVLTTTGDWPMIEVEINGHVYERPDILVR